MDPELKMTSNFGQAWKDLPFNDIVLLVCLFEQKPRRNLKKMHDVALPLRKMQDQEPALSKITRANTIMGRMA